MHIAYCLLLGSSVQALPSCRLRREFAFDMVESTINRGQGYFSSAPSTGLIEIGIFQQALRESIATTRDADQRRRWEDYLHGSIESTLAPLLNVSADVGLPLDRLSVGTSLILAHNVSGDEELLPAIGALENSATAQPRNANSGLWYYGNLANLSLYHNLSYLDGMYSYPSFTLLSAATNNSGFAAAAAVLQQLSILRETCRKPSGLLVHGYDASRAHDWADPATGSSPIVWARSLAWYTLGTLQALEMPQTSFEDFNVVRKIQRLFIDVVRAQVEAAERSLRVTGRFGVWQVVDRPGDAGNFVEASATCMTAYSFLKGARLGLLGNVDLERRAVAAAFNIYDNVVREFLIRESKSTLSLNGTSAVATLSVENVDYEYYVSRPRLLNSLIGTSAFTLASLEVERTHARARHASDFGHAIRNSECRDRYIL